MENNDENDHAKEENIEEKENIENSKVENPVENSITKENEKNIDTPIPLTEEIREQVNEEDNNLKNVEKDDVEKQVLLAEETKNLNEPVEEKAVDNLNDAEKSIQKSHSLVDMSDAHHYDREDLYRSSSFDIQECAQGQELLNELFFNKESFEISTETEEETATQDFLKLSVDGLGTNILVNRADLIKKIKDALTDRKSLMESNRLFQSQLVEHFKLIKAKQKNSGKLISEKDTLIDFNTQYERYMEILKFLVDDMESEHSKDLEKIEKLKMASEIKVEQNDESNKDFNKYQESTGLSALNSRTGFKLGADVIKDFFAMENKKEAIIKMERLSNLKMEHKNARFDKALRSKENFEGGLRLIDFEQLKIENQTFNEKVEERCEAINKLYRKITNCNHLLSHIKEKLSFTEFDKKQSNQNLQVLSKELKKAQKINNKIKKVRDYIKSNNNTLQMSCGLLGNKDYLKKYEESHDNVGKLRESIGKMQCIMRNASIQTKQLVGNINKMRKTSEEK